MNSVLFRRVALALVCMVCHAAPVVAEVTTGAIPGTPQDKAATEVKKKTSVNRIIALREHALSVGIAEGRLQRWTDVRRKMGIQKGELDTVYQVSHLYLEDGLLQPPVVLTSENLYQNKNDGRSVDWSQVRYVIAAPARFVTQQIDWFTYLVSDEDISQSTVPPDDPMLHPRSPEEEEAMKMAYQTGFSEGVAQVDIEIQARVKTLTTLVTGMYNYHILQQKNMIVPPQVSRLYTPTTGNATQISLSNRTFEVSEDSAFNLDSGSFRALPDRENPWKSTPRATMIP